MTLTPASISAIETRKMAVISTRHMTERDNGLLVLTKPTPIERPELFIAGYEYGWLFMVPNDTEEPSSIFWTDIGYSKELWENLRALRAAGFDRVDFDRDGPVIPGLHNFDW